MQPAPISAFSTWTAAEIAQVAQCPLVSIETNWPLVYSELQTLGQSSIRSCAAVIGTIAIETASTFEPVREAYWLSEDWRRGNLRYYPYYGRGFVQLTWDYNYKTIGDRIGVNLVDNPDMAMDPSIAAKSLAIYWSDRNIQAMADRSDWEACRRAVQGGTNGLDRLIDISNKLVSIAQGKGMI